MDATSLTVVIVIAVVILVVYAMERSRHKTEPTHAPSPAPSPTPVLDTIKQCIRDEGEKVREHVTGKHTELTGKVDALHKRWDKEDEKPKP